MTIDDSRTQTVGKIATDLSAKGHDSNTVIDVQRELQKDYMASVWECINRHLSLYSGDFYVQIVTKREKLLENVFRNYFMAHQWCPSPDYNQSMFKFHRSSNRLEYLWTLPDPETAIYLVRNASKLPPEEKELLFYVLCDYNGTLLKRAKSFNGEQELTPLLIKGAV
jgi:hypothetical protein